MLPATRALQKPIKRRLIAFFGITWEKSHNAHNRKKNKMHPCFDWHLLNGFRKTIAGPSRFQTRSWFGSSDYPKGQTLMPCDCRAWRPKCRLMKECSQHEMHELCVWMNCVFDVCLDRCVCESFSVRVAVSTNGFRRRFRRKKSGKKNPEKVWEDFVQNQVRARGFRRRFGKRFGHALVQSQVRFNTVLENVLTFKPSKPAKPARPAKTSKLY